MSRSVEIRAFPSGGTITWASTAKDIDGGQLVLSLAAWSSFVGHAARAQV